MASQYSKDGRYFAQISTEGKLKVWATSTSSFEHEFTPDFHLTSPCTCLHFIQDEPPKAQNHLPKKKKRRDSIAGMFSSTIALGTTSGRLLVYSIAKGELMFDIDSGTSKYVSCLSSFKDTVYSAAEHEVLCWDLSKKCIKSKWKAGNNTISAILVLPDGNSLVTASRNIRIWNVDTKQILRTFTGHSYEVSILESVSPKEDGDTYIISGSKGDRLLCCWNLASNNEDNNSVASLLMDDVPISLKAIIGDNQSTNIVATTRSGVVHYFQLTLNGKCLKPIKPATTVQVVSETSDTNSIVPISIAGATFSNPVSLLLGYGSLKLTFENLELSTKEKVQCLVRKHQGSETVKDGQLSKTKRPVVGNDVHYLTPATGKSVPSATKRKNDGTLEVPMEKRLENLALNKLDSDSKVPHANNVAQLLVQGLHSKDQGILRSVLQQSDETVIRNTVKRLALPTIVSFVRELAIVIQGKTQMSCLGSLWLKILVQQHATVLLSNPDLPELVAPVLGAIETRLQLQNPLNRLSGRLDLLLSHASVADVDTNESRPLLIFNDKDASESETEELDIVAHSDSDNEWNEETSEEEENGEDVDDDVEML